MAATELMAGEPLSTVIVHVDEDSQPITGETFVVDYAKRSDDTDFTVTITEVGGGKYRVDGTTLPTDPPGEWQLIVKALSNNAYYQQTFDVMQGRPQVVVAQSPTVAGFTRQQIRRQAAHALGDLRLAVATAFGTESTVVSEKDLAQEYGHYQGMQIVAVGGTPANLYQTGTVTLSSQENRTVTFIPPFPAATAPGDEFELYNFRGTGWRMEDYNAAINAAIQKAGEEHATKPYVVTLADAFDRSYPYATIPPEFSHFSGVEIVERDGRRRVVQPGGIRVNAGLREVALDRTWAQRAHGRTLRLIGYRMPGTLETDDARTDVGLEWIVTEVKAILLEHDSTQGTSQGARDRLFLIQRQGADGRRPSVVTTYAPNTVKLS